MSGEDEHPRMLYLFPYVVGVIAFTYALKLHNPYLLGGSIFFMFIAFMKPIYDWVKKIKENGNFDDEDDE